MLSCLVVRKSHYFSHNLYYYSTFLPSLTQTTLLVPGLKKAGNTGKQLCSPNKLFVVVLEKGFNFFNEISPFGVDFEICNFVDCYMPKHTHYTLTKIQKVKKNNRSPLIQK